MKTYAIYETKAARYLPVAKRVEALALVKDGFHWGAFLLSGIWLLWKGQGRVFLMWLGGLVVAGGLLLLLGFGFASLIWLWLAAALIIGFEAAGLERDGLDAEEATVIGYVAGGSRSDAEVAAVARLASVIDRERQDMGSADA